MQLLARCADSQAKSQLGQVPEQAMLLVDQQSLTNILQNYSKLDAGESHDVCTMPTDLYVVCKLPTYQPHGKVCLCLLGSPRMRAELTLPAEQFN